MVTFLRKVFIKNYADVSNQKVRTAHGVLAASCGIVINLILFIIKIIFGIFSKSMSIISDAINNLSDLFSCIVNLVGFKLAGKPADKEHPFGHERIEYICGMIVSVIIIAIALILGYKSITKLINQEAVTSYNYVTFIILAIAILGKLLLAYIYNGLGKAIDSIALKASKQDSLNDVICTSVILIASIVQFYFPKELWWLDSGLSILVALFILYSGIKLVIETSQPLIGLAPDKELVKEITRDILSRDGVLGIHDLIVHCYGPTKTFISIHVEVDGYQNIMDIHDMIDNIEEDISKKYKVEITIHMDPLDTKNKDIPILKDRLKEILDSTGEQIRFHDFRMVHGKTHTNLVFDVVLSPESKLSDEELISYIRNEFKKTNKKYNCVIKVDRDYIGE